MEIMQSCGFSCPATNATVRLSRSCFSVHEPESLASSIRRPNPSGDVGNSGLCFWLSIRARLSSFLNLLTVSRALARLGNGSRSRMGKFIKMGLNISRFTALWRTLIGALAEFKAFLLSALLTQIRPLKTSG